MNLFSIFSHIFKAQQIYSFVACIVSPFDRAMLIHSQSVLQGEVIHCLVVRDDGWCMGINSRGQVGYYPASYAVPLNDPSVPVPNVREIRGLRCCTRDVAIAQCTYRLFPLRFFLLYKNSYQLSLTENQDPFLRLILKFLCLTFLL